MQQRIGIIPDNYEDTTENANQQDDYVLVILTCKATLKGTEITLSDLTIFDLFCELPSTPIALLGIFTFCDIASLAIN
jgi:hypothetical protein